MSALAIAAPAAITDTWRRSETPIREQASQIARWQRAAGITRGRRTAKAIEALLRERKARAELRAEQAAAADPTQAAADLRRRAAARTLAAWTAEVARRGGETSIQGDTQSWGLQIVDRDRDNGLLLLQASGWRYYSRREGSHRATLSYLCGTDDNGPFAVRVSGTVNRVWEALEWITPAEVWRAPAADVRRQGDVYLLRVGPRARTTEAGDFGRNGSHHWDPETRTLVHTAPKGERKHRAVKAPKSWPNVKVLAQRNADNARGWARD